MRNGRNGPQTGGAWHGKLIMIVALMAISGLATCSRNPEQSVVKAPENGESGIEAPTPAVNELPIVLATAAAEPAIESGEDAVPSAEKAMIIFISGTAEKLSAGNSTPLEIGDFISQGETIRTGENSYCELQCGIQAVIKIRENTSFSLTLTDLHPEKSRVEAEVLAGSVLCKVRKLSGDSRFEVRTESAVCAVRGTEFMVSVQENVATRLSVKEGEVSILPKSVALDNLRSSDDPTLAEIAVKALSRMEESATRVGADREVTVTPGDVKNAELIGKTFETALRKIAVTLRETDAAAQDITPEIMAEIEKTADAAARKTVQTVDIPSATAAETQETLSELDFMRVIEIPAEIPVTDAGTVAAAGTQQEPRFTSVSVRTEPAGAAVYSEDRLMGTGGFSGLYPADGVLALSVRLDGYVTENIVIDLKKETAREFLITLKTDPQVLKIKTSPAGAEIFIDGERTGTGTWSGEFEAGKTVAVIARLQGYRDAEASVETRSGDTRVLNLTLEPITVPVTIAVQPPEAELFIDGKSAGKGTVSISGRIGSVLRISARLSGYEPAGTVHTAVENGANRVRLTLQRIKKSVSISVAPPEATVLINGAVAGTGKAEGVWEVGKTLSIELRCEGFVGRKISLQVAETMKPQYSFTLEREKRTISIRATPGDASILENGNVIGRGSVTLTRPLGEEASLTVTRDGYDEASLRVGFRDPVDAERTVSLTMKTVYARTRVSDSKLIGIAADESGTLFAASDSEGVVTGFDGNGRSLWKVRTDNTENENSIPVVLNGTVYFSGAKELAAIDGRTGAVLWRRELSSRESHIFGQRILPAGDRIYLPTSDGVSTLSGSGDSVKPTFRVDGNLMSPSMSADMLVIADQKGTVFVFDAAAGTVLKEIPTSAVQPVAQKITVEGKLGYFAGRKGNVVCADFETGKVVWQTVPKKNASGLFNDLLPGSGEIIVYAGGSILVLEKETGTLRFPAVEGVSAPPEYGNGSLWFGRETGELIRLNVLNGRVEKSFNPGGKITAKPYLSGTRLYLLLDTGDLAVLQTEAIP